MCSLGLCAEREKSESVDMWKRSGLFDQVELWLLKIIYLCRLNSGPSSHWSSLQVSHWKTSLSTLPTPL